jgi:hypothetical protein
MRKIISAAAALTATAAVIGCSSTLTVTRAVPGPTITKTVTVPPIPTPTGSPVQVPPSASAPAAVPECSTSDLAAALTAGNGTAGAVYYTLKLMNVSLRSCFTQGYPGVVAANAGGDLGAPATREHGIANAIILTPGSSAQAQVRYAEAATTTPGCDIANATELSVIPPDQVTPLVVPFDDQVCASDSVTLFQVWPVT